MFEIVEYSYILICGRFVVLVSAYGYGYAGVSDTRHVCHRHFKRKRSHERNCFSLQTLACMIDLWSFSNSVYTHTFCYINTDSVDPNSNHACINLRCRSFHAHCALTHGRSDTDWDKPKRHLGLNGGIERNICFGFYIFTWLKLCWLVEKALWGLTCRQQFRPSYNI